MKQSYMSVRELKEQLDVADDNLYVRAFDGDWGVGEGIAIFDKAEPGDDLLIIELPFYGVND